MTIDNVLIFAPWSEVYRVKMRTLAIIMVKYFRPWGEDEDIVT
jgi:hypothetical protein